MPNPSQEHPLSSKAPDEDLKDLNVLCTFKIKTESQNSKTSDYINIKIKTQNPGQEPPASSKAPNQDLMDIFSLQIQKSVHGCTKVQWQYKIQDQDANLSQEPPASSKAPNQDLKIES